MSTIVPFTGNAPSNVSKDAKYSVGINGEIRLLYRINNRERELLATNEHEALAARVNAVKVAKNGTPGGAFYINEYGDILVPDLAGNCWWAGHYDGTLEFDFEDGRITPSAPAGLERRQRWPGPHVGIKYVLAAGGADVKYVRRSGRREITVMLSDEVGADGARQTANWIAEVKGRSGGRFYINERSELFCPTVENDYAHFVYIGALDDRPWFDPPEGFDRP